MNQPKMPAQTLLETFTSGSMLNWRIINDGVMGGRSNSQIEILPGDIGRFRGNVSLDNFGGFASTRAILPVQLKDGYTKVLLKVKGDGKKYSFRIRTDVNFDGVSYKQDFTTKAGEWQEIELVLANFIPTWRGRRLRNVPPIAATKIRQIGFFISDKQEGNFELLVDWVGLK